MTQLESNNVRRRWPLWAILLVAFATAWVLHTVSGLTVVGIDTFCRGIGMEPPELPEAQDGAPSRETVGEDQLNRDLAYVPTIDPFVDGPLQKEFFPGGPPTAAHIRRALTYVPDTQRAFWQMANVLYMNGQQMRDFSNEYRAISHAQIELIAGRVSAINQCVY